VFVLEKEKVFPLSSISEPEFWVRVAENSLCVQGIGYCFELRVHVTPRGSRWYRRARGYLRRRVQRCRTTKALTEPGGIYGSGTVHDEVRNRLPCAFDDLGEREKRVAGTVRAQLTADAIAALPKDEADDYLGGCVFGEPAPSVRQLDGFSFRVDRLSRNPLVFLDARPAVFGRPHGNRLPQPISQQSGTAGRGRLRFTNVNTA